MNDQFLMREAEAGTPCAADAHVDCRTMRLFVSPMKFAYSNWLFAALLIVPAALALFRWGALRRRRSLDRIVAPRLHDKLVRSVDHWKRGLKSTMILTALALLCASIARPLYGLREAQGERAGVDVIIALDVSRSMMAEDAPSNRLTSAKLAITRLLDRPSS